MYVIPSAQHKGHSKALVKCALSELDTGIFATSRANNDFAHASLKGAGFDPAGERYESIRHKHGLRLFLRLK